MLAPGGGGGVLSDMLFLSSTWFLALSPGLGHETATVAILVDGALYGSWGVPATGDLWGVPPKQERRRMGDSFAAAAVDRAPSRH